MKPLTGTRRALRDSFVKLKLQSSQTLLVRNGNLDYKQGEQLWCFALNNLGEHIGSPLLIKQYTLHTKR